MVDIDTFSLRMLHGHFDVYIVIWCMASIYVDKTLTCKIRVNGTTNVSNHQRIVIIPEHKLTSKVGVNANASSNVLLDVILD